MRAGLRGGKGIPESVGKHPAIFVTLTAPSFGAVHRGDDHERCRSGRDRRCPHGRLITCSERHDRKDRRVGQPLCPACYDYERAILWNALAPELWRRGTIAIRRELAKVLGLTEAALSRRLRLSFAKVVEYQQRGAVHIHAVIRADGASDKLLPGEVSPEQLVMAAMRAFPMVSVGYPAVTSGTARFGAQLRVEALNSDDERLRRRISGYIAKYATKSSDAFGGLDRRIISRSDLRRRKVSEHHRRLAEVSWRLGGLPELEGFGLRRFAHALGFRGHWLTKSRQWSTTFHQLRADRLAYRLAHLVRPTPDVQERDEDEEKVAWSYLGTGWADAGEELHVRSRRQAEDFAREQLREVYASTASTGPRANDGPP